MAWNALVDFADNSVVKNSMFNAIIENIDALKNSGDNGKDGFFYGSFANQTVSTTLVKLTDERWTMELDVVRGDDVLIFARLFCSLTTTTGASVGFVLYVDGEPYQFDPATDTYMYGQLLTSYNTAINPMWIVPDLSIGTHTFELYAVRYGATYTLVIENARRDGIFGVEL